MVSPSTNINKTINPSHLSPQLIEYI